MPQKYKYEAVDAIKERLSRAKSLVVTDYRGLSVEEMTTLRDKLRAEGVEYKVVKNRLAQIALQQSGMDPLESLLKGTKAIAFGIKDPVSPAKVLTAYAKENEKLKVVGGLMDNVVLDAKAVGQLAQIPSREVLLGRLVGSLSSPVQKLAMSLHQTVAKLAYALDAVSRKKAEQGA